MTNSTADSRLEWLNTRIYEIRNEIASGNYPNWYPATLAQFQVERTKLILAS